MVLPIVYNKLRVWLCDVWKLLKSKGLARVDKTIGKACTNKALYVCHGVRSCVVVWECMCMCVCVCVCVCVYVCVCVRMCVCRHTSVCFARVQCFCMRACLCRADTHKYEVFFIVDKTELSVRWEIRAFIFSVHMYVYTIHSSLQKCIHVYLVLCWDILHARMLTQWKARTCLQFNLRNHRQTQTCRRTGNRQQIHASRAFMTTSFPFFYRSVNQSFDHNDALFQMKSNHKCNHIKLALHLPYCMLLQVHCLNNDNIVLNRNKSKYTTSCNIIITIAREKFQAN